MIYPKDIVVLVNFHPGNQLIPNSTLYYRFFKQINGYFENVSFVDKNKVSSEIFEDILNQFLVDKQLISLGYGLRKMTSKSEEYYGIKLENSASEKLSIYYSSKALSFADDINHLILPICYHDFYEYCKKTIECNEVKRITIRPGEEQSRVLYVFDNQEKGYLQKRRELGIYYRESLGKIDSIDLSILLSVIRLFINKNLSFPLYYKYEGCKLLIGVEDGSFIEMNSENLIDTIEKSRILDDLWLLMHGLIQEMPTQEESMENKDYLRSLRKSYLDQNVK